MWQRIFDGWGRFSAWIGTAWALLDGEQRAFFQGMGLGGIGGLIVGWLVS